MNFAAFFSALLRDKEAISLLGARYFEAFPVVLVAFLGLDFIHK